MHPSEFDLTGQVALVTGASRGLGQDFARALAAAGADLVITSRQAEDLQPFANELRQLQREVHCLSLDVTQLPSIQAAVTAAIELCGRIEILVNNAGCNVRKPAIDVTWDDWNKVIDTNLRGSFFMAQSVARHMLPQRYGRIINVGSVTCIHGYAGLGPYGASRGGIKQLTMSLAHDWGSQGITVNCLAPGWFKTQQNQAMYDDPDWVEMLNERIPLGRPGAPTDLDGALLLLASPAGKYITGQTILVDGGISTGAIRALPKETPSP